MLGHIPNPLASDKKSDYALFESYKEIINQHDFQSYCFLYSLLMKFIQREVFLPFPSELQELQKA